MTETQGSRNTAGAIVCFLLVIFFAGCCAFAGYTVVYQPSRDTFTNVIWVIIVFVGFMLGVHYLNRGIEHHKGQRH